MDTVFGLPAHPLLVHAVIVLLPLTALLGIAAGLKTSWAFYLRWPLLVLAVVGAGSAWLAQGAGEQLQGRLGSSPAIEEHSAAGDLLVIAAMILLVTVIAMVLTTPVHSPLASGAWSYTGAGPRWLSHIVRVATLGVALWVLVQTARTGHSGASAVWKDIVASTVPGG